MEEQIAAILDCMALAAPRDLARLGRYLGIRVPQRPLSLVEHAVLLQAVRNLSAVPRDGRPHSFVRAA